MPTRPGATIAGLCIALLALAAVAQSPAPKVLRWSASGDVVTLDPHAPPDTFSDGMLHNIYERLLTRDRSYQLAPSLAVSWTALSPTRMQLQLRKGVVFHEGEPFTADDVVFSLKRMQRPLSSQRASLAGVKDVVRVDDFTVDVITERPLPSLLHQLGMAPILCKSWLLKHGSAEPHDYTGGKESYSARNANGTGPYRVRSHENGVKLVMAANPRWWGKREGNADEVVFRPISANATRMAALLSGETDLLLDPPPQDIERVAANPQLKVVSGPEHRVVLLSFDAMRDELLFSDVKGRNPFKDRRVREAIALSIDTEAIHRKVMRGLSLPTGTVLPQGVTGYSEKAARRVPPDLERARRLLAEAGYAQGFGVTLDCTNDRYVLDEQICVALAAMIGKAGIRVTARPQQKALFFQRVDVVKRETSFFMVGIASPTPDGMLVLDSLLHTFGHNGLGENNIGRFSSAKIDAVLDAARTELDPAKRGAFMEEAQVLQKQEVFYIPIHQQVTPWAMRRNIGAVHRPDNYLDLRWVTVN